MLASKMFISVLIWSSIWVFVFIDESRAQTSLSGRLTPAPDIGAAVAAYLSANSSGTTFPAAPYGGQQFYRSDLGDTFLYDGVRWLGSPVVLAFTKDGDLDGEQMDFGSVTVSSASRGPSWSADVLIVSIEGNWSNSVSSAKNLRVRQGTTTLATISLVGANLPLTAVGEIVPANTVFNLFGAGNGDKPSDTVLLVTVRRIAS